VTTKPTEIQQLEAQLDRVLIRDRYRLTRALARIRTENAGRSAATAERLSRIAERVSASVEKRKWRQAHRPTPVLNANLPIYAARHKIITAIRTQPVLIISGETGSGKTTQIPQMSLGAGRGDGGLIGCTQPRRIAAVTVAQRIAEEIGDRTGQSVGYKIRFADRTRSGTFVKIMTDGILLAEAQGDRFLSQYDTLIVDEAHERSLNIDFSLGLLKTLQRKRPDLRIIITSATIDTEKFSTAFDRAPVIEVSGRLFPVEVRYRPEDPESADGEERTHVDLAIDAVEGLRKEGPSGDILVFMPTEQDIRETCERIEAAAGEDVRVLPLFARLSADLQRRVFAPASVRTIIVATNVAETSITIPGIRYVVDTGLARISRYTPRTRTTSLPVVPVSRSSADQRMGRCGRVEAGVCVRLYSESDYLSRPLYTPPEILRANLAEVILRMISLKLGEIDRFPFIDPPAGQSVTDGFKLLLELGAIRDTGRGRRKGASKGRARYTLTDRGKRMARMPIDPRLSRMLIEAEQEGCTEEMAVIVSALSIQDPRERPAGKTEAADAAQARFLHPESDFLTLLNIWSGYLRSQEEKKGWGSLKRFCKAHRLSFRRMREWQDIHRQITGMLNETGVISRTHGLGDTQWGEMDAGDRRYGAIHRSILSGFLSAIALRKEGRIFTATRGREVMLFPGSGLFKRPPAWIVAAEMVETSRLFARTAAAIDPGWLEGLGGNLCRYTYLNPRWERNRGEVVATEQVRLFGLIIEPGRSVSYGRIDPESSGEIFIRSALIDGDVKRPLPFMTANREEIEKIRNVEDRVRRRDILFGEADLYQFYRDRLPAGICDMRSLAAHLKAKGGDGDLRMTASDLVHSFPDDSEMALFPDSLTLGGRRFRCDYRFDPGKPDDGITVRIPSTETERIPADRLDWLVPGLLQDKVTTLIRSLPKKYRKHLVPVANTVDVIVRELPDGDRPLVAAMGDFIYRRFGLDIPASAWPESALPDYLKMRISIVGPGDEELRSGRDKAVLREAVSLEIDPDMFDSLRKKWERDNITTWDFGDLPETLPAPAGRPDTPHVFPVLERAGRGVGLRLFLDRNRARTVHREGVAALFEIRFSKELKFLKKQIALSKEAAARAAYFGGAKQIEKEIFDRLKRNLFALDLRRREAFESNAERIEKRLFSSGRLLMERILPVLDTYHDTRSRLDGLARTGGPSSVGTGFLNERRTETERLVPDSFIRLYDPERMVHLPRYLRAIAIRAERGVVNPEKDRIRTAMLRPFVEALTEMLETLSPEVSEEKRAAVESYHWLLEEFKVSVFAQELGTAVPVSEKKLQEKIRDIERLV
jgi:ATP-dependent helicase HrpA